MADAGLISLIVKAALLGDVMFAGASDSHRGRAVGLECYGGAEWLSIHGGFW